MINNSPTTTRARAKLGRLLEKVERGTGPGRGKKNAQSGQSFLAYLRELGLERKRADEVQRIAAIPDQILSGNNNNSVLQ